MTKARKVKVVVTRRQTFRLYPNKAQEKALFDARRLHCYIYNACVAHRRYEWRANKKSVSYFEQQNCLPAFKKDWPEFAYLAFSILASYGKTG